MNARDHSVLRLLALLSVGFGIVSLAGCGRSKVAHSKTGLEFDSDEFDAGNVQTNAPIAHRFVIHNSDNHDVQLSKVTTSSPLVTTQASTMVVPAGGDAFVDVTLNLRKVGDASENVTILDSTGSTYQLNIRANYQPKVIATATPAQVSVAVDGHATVQVALQSTVPIPRTMRLGLQTAQHLASAGMGEVHRVSGRNAAGLYETDYDILIGRNDRHSTDYSPGAESSDELTVAFDTKPRVDVRIPISFLAAELTSSPSKLIFAAGESIPPAQIMTIHSSDVAPTFERTGNSIPWLKIAPAENQPNPNELAIAFTPIRAPGAAQKKTISVMVGYKGNSRSFNIEVWAWPAGQ